MVMKSFAVATVALASLGSVPASAATQIPAVFNFTVGSNSGINDGNARYYSATSSQYGTFNVRATGWSLYTKDGATTVQDSKLMVYSGGLGVLSGDDGTGSGNTHTIDNHTRRDFILFQFDRRVQFVSATFNTYSVLNNSRDSDATIKYGDTDVFWKTGLGLDQKSQSYLNGLFEGSYTSLSPVGANGNSNTRNINPDDHTGNLWLVGADFRANTDGKIDGFKFTNLAVIPEPATWAMMIGGFGLVGATMRRRTRRTRAALA